ncbi:MAG: ABC transporter permease [Actinomycetota bacterium]|jgi:ABC-2 type transport system permease protein
MSAPEVQVRTNEPPRLKLLPRLRELWRSREILANLAKKERKAKYKSTALGAAWSMLNPLLYLVVFYVVFTVFLPSGIPVFPVYLLSGLLPWTLFSTGLAGATVSVTGNAQLVSKVAFAKEYLPLATIRAQTVNFFYQFAVLVVFVLVFGYPLIHKGLVLLPLAFVVLLLFVSAVGMATAAWNVRYRDMGYLVELLLLAWFWSTPIVYPAATVLDRLGPTGQFLYLLNPMANIVLGFQRAVYGGVSGEALRELPRLGVTWYGARLLALGAVSLVILYLSWRLFFRNAGDFAEEL